MNQMVAQQGPTPIPYKDTRKFVVTSHSIDGTFESCNKRFMFRHLYEEMPVAEPRGLAADVGTALHEAVQDWTRHGSLDRAGMILMRWWPWELEQKREAAGLKDHKRTLGNALLLLQAICEHEFWDDWEVASLPGNELAIELAWRINHISIGSFKHPVHKYETFLATQGKIDWILQHRVNRKKFMVTDLKTTIMGEEAQQASFRFSGQAGQYGLVTSHAIGYDWMLNGLDVCYLVAEFGESGSPVVIPHEYHLEPEEILEAIEAKNVRLRRMLDAGRSGFWPRRTHGCAFYQTPCGFLGVCHRSEPEFLWDWFEEQRDKFKKESRVYDPYWIIEA